jgi:hypothetical protein
VAAAAHGLGGPGGAHDVGEVGDDLLDAELAGEGLADAGRGCGDGHGGDVRGAEGGVGQRLLKASAAETGR